MRFRHRMDQRRSKHCRASSGFFAVTNDIQAKSTLHALSRYFREQRREPSNRPRLEMQ